MTRLVLAHAGDDEAARIARELGARLVTPRALSQRGWRHYPVGGGADRACVGDGESSESIEPIDAAALTGVITRIAAVQPADLPHIAAVDRGYIAAEMTAFLLSFLGGLPCPVVNRPTPSSLMGPGWTPLRWRAVAIANGLPPAAPDDVGERIVAAFGRCLGARDEASASAVLALARAAGVELLAVRVTAAGRFASAEPWAPLAPDALAAVAARLGGAA